MASIKISCAGDFLPADTMYNIGKGIGTNVPCLIDFFSIQESKPFIDSDIAFCNLESPLIATGENGSRPFAGNPDIIRIMKILDISVVSVANNHMLDYGQSGLDQTAKYLDENGLFHVGSIEHNLSRIVWINCKGKKIAFTAFNAIEDHPDNTLIAPLKRDILFNTLNEIAGCSPDYTVISIHWGDEYVTWPSPTQIDLAHELVERGVNIIIGHHPHVVQPIEKYKGGLIIYSLGNFLFDMFWSEKVRNGMQVELILNEDQSIDYQIKPYWIRKNFTQDYTRTEKVYSILENAEKEMKFFREGNRGDYEKKYRIECKKRRLEARIKMKLYLLLNIFSLSYQSRNYLLRNILSKFKSS